VVETEKSRLVNKYIDDWRGIKDLNIGKMKFNGKQTVSN